MKNNNKQRKCTYCGQFFKPDPRVGERQKSCKRVECHKKRKKEAQKHWESNNPGYFRDRYSETKGWRKRHPDYQRNWRRDVKRSEIQDKIPTSKPVRIIHLAIRADLLKAEIQDKILLVRQCSCGFWVAGGDT